MKENSSNNLEKSYFDVLGLCCSSEVPLIEKILRPIEGIHDVSVIVPSRTVIVVHDPILVSQHEIVKALNQARLEANLRVKGDTNHRDKWPSPFAMACGVLLLLSFLSYFFPPLKWLALGAVAVGIIPIILKSIASLRNFRLDVNTLMLIAVMGSIYLKDYWEAGTVVFLFTTAQWLEARAGHKATAVMSSLMNMAPQKAVLANNGEEVNANEVMVNTKLAVKAGDVIPIDGIVVQGRCEVDEKALTGESFPVSKQKDSIVWAGTINLNGYIIINTTVVAGDCVVAKMAKLVEEAQNNKCKTQRYIDECAKYYTPAVVIVAACLAVIPTAMRLRNLDKWFHLALVVLVSSCPCALILSTPVATYCALSKAATIGLLIKGAEYLETLSTVKIFAFDKTGTMTRGEFTVSDFRSLIDHITLDKLLYWVSSIECKSSHPMASALVDYAESHSVKPQSDNVEEFENFPGEGIYGNIEGMNVYIGNRKIASRAGCSTDLDLNGKCESMEGKSKSYIFVGTSLAGVFSLQDSCRTGVKEALNELKSMGIKSAMLTGDCQSAANHAQNQLGGALEIVHAGLLPQDKARIIKEFQKQAPTAMIGDGINDAPALATADIGISMGISGSALATETGHIILMSNDIRKLPVAVKLARKTRTKIFQNIYFSIITKAAIIAVALAGHPLVWLAVLADVGTCLVVIGNSMLLLRAKTVSGIGTKHAHKHCHSSNNRSKGCCGHDGKVHESKRGVQGAEDHKHGCCGHDHHVHNVNHSVHGKDKTEDHDHHSCLRDDGNVHVVKHIIQETARTKDICCSNSNEKIIISHECCDHGDKVHEVKQSKQVHESHGCCHDHYDTHVDGEAHKGKHMVQVVENKHGCFGQDLDVESQITNKKSQSHHETHSNSSHICKGDHHHEHVKEYITEEDLGEMVRHCCENHEVGGCCKSFRKECCVVGWRGGFDTGSII